MTVVWFPVDSYTPGRPSGNPQYIVDHWTVGNAHSTEVTFSNIGNQASAHYLVRRDGVIEQFVDENDRAWHAGIVLYNELGIGIEHEHFDEDDNTPGLQQDWPDVQLRASAELHRSIQSRWHMPLVHVTDGSPGVIRHRETGRATQCPGDFPLEKVLELAATVPVLGPSRYFVDPVADWANLYLEQGPHAGVRAEIAFAQALKETNHFQFTGIARPEWNNPAGLGVTGAPDVGNRFATKRDGVIAHLQHLLMYFTPAHTPYCTPQVDQRHFAHRGYPNDITQLDGRWAVPGVGYGQSIAAIAAGLGADVSFTDDPAAIAYRQDVKTSFEAVKAELARVAAKLDAIGGAPITLVQIAATQPAPLGFHWVGTQLVQN